MMWLLSILLLHPVVDEPTDLRLISDQETTWILDGVDLGQTEPQEFLEVLVGAGAHEIVAESSTKGDWTILARPTTSGEGLQYVPSWTAKQVGSFEVNNWPAIGFLGLGIALIFAPRWSRRPLE